MELKEIYEKMHSGELYDPGEVKLLVKQLFCLGGMYRFNRSRPVLGFAHRMILMKTMLAECGEGTYINPPFYANWGGKHVHVGRGVYINSGFTAVDDTHIYIGDYTELGPNVVVATAGHPIWPEYRGEGPLQYNLPVRIGRNCWIGAGAILLPGVTIGDDSVIGAGSVVTKDVPSGVVAVGNPCRVMREINESDRERKSRQASNSCLTANKD